MLMMERAGVHAPPGAGRGTANAAEAYFLEVKPPNLALKRLTRPPRSSSVW